MITPTKEQAAAIKKIVEWYKDPNQREFYLAGYAGTGKSTIFNIALEELQQTHKVSNVKVGAYTGKAASVLRKKGIGQAQTIHSMIYKPVEDKETGKLKFILSPDSDASEAHLIALDECSMVDNKLASDLRSYGKKILVMGDPGQLPPVNGLGAFTNRKPDVFLQEIHRQAADSPIIRLATMVRKGEALPKTFSEGKVKVQLLTKESQELVYNQNTQPICGLNRVRHAYTQRIRQRLGFEGREPLPGERIMCCKNNQELGIFNGQMGELISYEEEKRKDKLKLVTLKAELEDRGTIESNKVDPYLFKTHFDQQAKKLLARGMWLDEFDWAYIITCHKAQGSQWEHVTIVDDSQVFKENSHRWMYTALTRSERGLTVLLRD